MSRFLVSLSVLLLVLPLACAKREETEPVVDRPEAKAPADPTVRLVVNGIEIRQDEIDRAVEFFRLAKPHLDDNGLISHAINNDLIPTAAARAHYRDRLPALEEKVNDAYRAIEKGEDFRRASIRFAKNYDRREPTWRYAREFVSSTLGNAAFETPKGSYTRPLLTVMGFRILRIDDELKLGDPQDHKVKISQIIVNYEPAEAFAKSLKEIQDNTEVTWIHPDYANYVNAKFSFRF